MSGEGPVAGEIDRLVIQQYDSARAATIGGIDTCIRGLLACAPPDARLGVVGVVDAVAALSAPRVVREIFFDGGTDR